MKLHIFTTVVNRPDFVKLQKKLFDKFLINKYEFHVIDDSIENDVSLEFQSICKDYSTKYYRIPPATEVLTPAQACARAIQWTYDNIILNYHRNDYVLFLDSDMFLIDDFDVIEYLSHDVLAGHSQQRGPIEYVWNGIMIFNMKKIIEIDEKLNFSDGNIEGYYTDVGGHMWHYFQKNNLKFKATDIEYPTHFNDIELCNEELTKGYNFELHLNHKFLHYRAASNWHTNWKSISDPLTNKTKVFNQIIDNILNDQNGQK